MSKIHNSCFYVDHLDHCSLSTQWYCSWLCRTSLALSHLIRVYTWEEYGGGKSFTILWTTHFLKYIMFLLAVLARHLAPMEQSRLKEKSKWEFFGFWSWFNFARIRIRGKMNTSKNNSRRNHWNGAEVLLLMRSRWLLTGQSDSWMRWRTCTGRQRYLSWCLSF